MTKITEQAAERGWTWSPDEYRCASSSVPM